MYAIVRTGGKQYKVSEGDIIKVELLKAEKDEKVELEVLMAADGEKVLVGRDAAGVKVSATVVGEGKGKKVIVYKYKRKTGYHKKNGHRQAYTQVKIEKINA